MRLPATGGRVAVVGSANVDYVVRVPVLPAAGETVVGGDLRRFPGGKGANQAVAAARLGGEVSLVARVGADGDGHGTIEGLERERVRVEHVGTEAEAPTGAALVVVDETGENAIAVAPGANHRLAPSHVEAAADVLRGADVLLLQLETPLEASRRAIELARAAGTSVVLNPAPARPLGRELLASVDVLVPNLGEARALASEAGIDADEDPESLARALRAAGVGRVAVTLGAGGVALAGPACVERLPAVPAEAVDTTAAGDAFSGALAVGLAGGLGWREAAAFAALAAALSVSREGARPSLPTLEEVRRATED